jgi:glutamine synthetase
MVNSRKIRNRALFCDLLNLPRGKYLPKDVAASGKVGFARGAFAVSFDRDLLPVPGCGFYDGLPDMELVLDEGRRKSWQPNTEIALGDLQVDDEPFGLCARSQLRRTIGEWEDLGLFPMVGLETEAYLFQRDSDGVWRPYDTPGAFVYGTGPSNDPLGVMDDIWEMANLCDIPIESMNGEFDNGQFELTLRFNDPLKACDDAFLMRMMAREIALKKELLITFLPKPIPDRGGSGLHINFSFVDGSGQNVIAPTGSLSKVAQQSIAGLISHHEGLSGLLASTVNSYDRLNPASMAGYWANWAEDHRLVTTRTSTKTPKSARLEHRMADCASNPYLAVTAVLQAAKLGVIKNLPLTDAEDLDGIENTRATRHAPPSLDRAIDALDNDALLRNAVGSLLCDALIFLKRDEFNRLKGKTVDQVRDFYLPFI